MDKQRSRARFFALLLGAIALVFADWAGADPPTRVARLGYTSGAVSFSPAGEDDWVLATMNRPLITGDRLWVDAGARAELQVGSGVIRMSGNTSVTLLNLDDRVTQVQMAQGTLNVRVRSVGTNEVFEVDTPNLAYSIRRPGEYRIEVDPASDTTTVVVRNGQAEAYGEGAAYVVNAQQAYRFVGTDLRDYEYISVPRADEFDRWSSERDRRGAVSARYVSRDVIGYEDLDDYGSWRTTEGYGNAWVPTRVAAGWAPYRDGHWAWVDPWGWTWVDDAPWGFAVSHYGRWTNIRGTWGWIPGPIGSRAVYAPALVAFIGGSNFQIAISTGNVAGVAWFALGPRDVYRPSYPVSRNYFNNINTSNTTINTTNITNVYQNVNVRNITYINQQVPNAIVAVPHTTFVQSQPVGRAAVRISNEAIAKSPVTEVAAVAPVHASVRGASAPGRRPPAEALKRPVVAKAPPPPAPIPFAAKQSALAAQPGRPLDTAALAAVKPTEPIPAPPVKVVSPTQRAVAPPKKDSAARREPQAREGTKGVQSPAAKERPLPSEAQKGPQVPEAEKAPQPPVTRKAPQPPVTAPQPPEAKNVQPPLEAQKGRQRPEVQEAPRPPEARKAPQPPVTAPQPPEAKKVQPPTEVQKGRQRPEVQEAPQPPEARKAPQPPVTAPQPPVTAPQPPEAKKVQPPPEAQKGRQRPDMQEAPQPPEARKAPQPAVAPPQPPEAKKVQPPPEAQKGRQRPEVQEAPQPPEARKAPQPPVTAPQPPVTAPPEAKKAQPPLEAQKGRQRPEVEDVPTPSGTVPKPPAAQKALPEKAEAVKSAEKRGAKKGDEQRKLEEEEKNRNR